MTTETVPHPVDVHVGARIRLIRKDRGMSQGELADALGITFQQVQKYERGFNRISASKMFEASKALGVDPAWFFQGLDDLPTGAGPDEEAIRTMLGTDEGRKLLSIAAHLPSPILGAHLHLMHMEVGALAATAVDTAENVLGQAA